VKENPFEVVRYSVDNVKLESTSQDNLLLKDVSISVSAYHRQGSLANIQKIDIRYFANLGDGEKDITRAMSQYFPTSVDNNGTGVYKWNGQAGENSQGVAYMKVKIYAFTNNGGNITYGESEWIEVK
jgi:hypothetical protein